MNDYLIKQTYKYLKKRKPMKNTINKVLDFLVGLAIVGTGFIGLAMLSSIIDHTLEMIWRLF